MRFRRQSKSPPPTRKQLTNGALPSIATKSTAMELTTTSAYVVFWCAHVLLPVVDQAVLGNGHGAYDARPLSRWDWVLLLPLVCTILSMYTILLRSYGFQSISTKAVGGKRTMMLVILTHAVDLVIRWDRMPVLWDHEFWGLLISVSFFVAFVPTCSVFHTSTCEEAAETWFLSMCRWQFGLLYGSAAFWKLNTSFFDVGSSCGTLLVLEFFGSYLTPFFSQEVPLSVTFNVAKLAPYITVIGESVISACMLLFAKRRKDGSNYIYGDFGVGLAIGFHTAIFLLPVNSAGGFSMECMSRLICFFDSAEITQVLHRMRCSLGFRWFAGTFLLAAPFGLAVLRIRVTGVGPDAGFLANGFLLALYTLLIRSSPRRLSNDTRKSLSETCALTFYSKWMKSVAVLLLTVSYAFVFPVLGIQQMGASTMYGNLRNYGRSNHYLVPTAVLGDDLLFGGGLVQILHSTSETLNLHFGHIDSLSLFPERVVRLVSAARGDAHDAFPLQLFPYCMRIRHSRDQLMDAYTGSKERHEAAGWFLPYVAPISFVSQMLHKAADSGEEFVVKLVAAGTSENVNTAETNGSMIVVRTSLKCEIYDGSRHKDCAKDITAKRLLDPQQRGGFLHRMVDKLLMPYPQPVRGQVEQEEACIT